MSPWATRDDEADDAASPAGSEIGGFSFGHCSADELAAFGVAEGTYLAPTILTYAQHARRIEANKFKFQWAVSCFSSQCSCEKNDAE